MKVKQLKELLSKFPDSYEVLIAGTFPEKATGVIYALSKGKGDYSWKSNGDKIKGANAIIIGDQEFKDENKAWADEECLYSVSFG